MPPKSSARALPLVQEPPILHNACPDCPEAMDLAREQIAAGNRQAVATEDLAEAVKAAIVTLQPAADVIAGFGARLDALCVFGKKWGPWCLASMPMVLVTIGAISPNAAAVLKAFLANAGVTP